jgi:hypothetical protein
MHRTTTFCSWCCRKPTLFLLLLLLTFSPRCRECHLEIRVARCYIFRPKIAVWINFGGPCNGRYSYISWTFGLFYGHLIYFMDIWYILWYFGIFFPSVGILYQEKYGNPALNGRVDSGETALTANDIHLMQLHRFPHHVP